MSQNCAQISQLALIVWKVLGDLSRESHEKNFPKSYPKETVMSLFPAYLILGF